MKIFVYNDDEKIKINLPTWLALNNFTYPFIANYLKRKDVKIKAKDLKKLVKICKKYKKTHPEWKLLETESESSEKVLIEI